MQCINTIVSDTHTYVVRTNIHKIIFSILPPFYKLLFFIITNAANNRLVNISYFVGVIIPRNTKIW